MLTSIKEFYNALEVGRLQWCHWKSNATLSRTVEGLTDLDLLFYEKDRNNVEQILDDIGAVKFQAVNEKRYPGIDDFLLIDKREGILIHFHVHYQLDVGEKFVKSYRLPFTDEIIASRVKHPDIDFWISRSEIELILLIIRQALRISPFGRIGKRLPVIGQATQAEFEWLKARIHQKNLSDVSYRWFGRKIADEILDIVNQGITVDGIRNFRRVLRPAVKQYRRMGDIAVFFRLLFCAGALRIKRVLSNLGFRYPAKRTMINRGLIVALIGCDGSGKSSLLKVLFDLFDSKLDVEKIYFGHGASHRSWRVSVGRLLRKLSKCCIFLPKARREMLGNILFAIGVALDKKKKFSRLEKMLGKGMLILCDRFPQTTHPGLNDGTQISKYIFSKSRLVRYLIQWEQSIYSLGNKISPDMIFRITTDPQIAYNRKKGSTDIETIKRKNMLMKSIYLPVNSKVIEVENNEIDIIDLKKKMAVEIWDVLWNKKNHGRALPVKRIDFFGLPGTGKSAIYRELVRQRRKKDCWLASSEVKTAAARQGLFIKKTTSVKDHIKQFVLKTDLLRPLHKLCLESLRYKEYLFDKRVDYRKLLNAFCDSLGSSPEDPLLKVQRAKWLLDDLEIMATADANRMEKTVVFDEGIMQKIITWFDIQDASELNGFPLPCAFVYFYCDPEVAGQRLKTRSKVAFQHSFFDNEQLENAQNVLCQKFQKVVPYLRSCGINGLEVDTSKPLQDNVNYIQKFLRNIQRDPPLE